MSRRTLVDDDAAQYARLEDRVRRLENIAQPRYTNATKPAATDVEPGTIIFVSDGGAGAVYQGSNGTSWVNLG